MIKNNRLLQYALHYKKTLFLALFMLVIAVSAELTGPFIAKTIIDDHILGIEKSWYQTEEREDAVLYENEWYVREDRLLEDEKNRADEVRILQVDRTYYFIPESISFDGDRSYSSGELTIKNGDQEQTYQAEKLSVDQLLTFYEPEVDGLIQLMVLYFVLLVIASFLHYGQGYYLQVTSNRIIQRMRGDVFSHIQTLPISYFDNLPAGKIVSRITNDTEAIRELYVKVLATFVSSIIYMTGIYVGLFLLNVQLALICLGLVPILFIWFRVYRKFATDYNQRIRSLVSDINAMINESIQGMPIIRAFNRQKVATKEFEQVNEEHFTYQNKMLNLNSLLSHNLVGFFRNVAFVTLIWFFGRQYLSGIEMISIGVIYAFVDYLSRLFQPIAGMVNQLAQLEQARVASQRVFELLDKEGIPLNTKEVPKYKGDVRFEHVSFAYKEDEYVLKDIDFEAKKGETIALVGHTGSGKSSIINLLFRFYDIIEGDIKIDGKSIKELSRQQLRSNMGIVLQDPFLFTGTIASNVSLDKEEITRETVEKALKDVGADKILKDLPNGMDEPVVEKGSTLSSGQRQLISFARALAFDPTILILDEATANIDSETEALIQEALEVVKKGRTTFVIAHRLSTIKEADQILVLDQGRIVERGNHEQLLALKGKYYQMYQLQLNRSA
ncbi:ABC transporter ATP-binding protein [Bacillus carboniphilus]|uniref:ABC transporter ATP-binding protein n=1 Tax=Bacillus carboniphilus TaxID=86663 RepID=A0ABY9JTP3_9BACI|nr:ABC transporter ATP-binding protein [Bacillus carboniphilus]WLR42771.1 ABC transporter ATP-binding protein [Bacillus carboniphilus]